jgi:butyrate kinase
MAHSDYMVSRLKEYLSWLAPIAVYPGENEMLALAQNALAVLNGEISPKTYE